MKTTDQAWSQIVLAVLAVGFAAAGCVVTGHRSTSRPMGAYQNFQNYQLDYQSPCDPILQQRLESIDATLRARHGLAPSEAAVGVLDLQQPRLALLRPDHEEYGASVPKIGILLAWFQLRPEAARHLDSKTRHELGQMIKASSNEAATRFSKELGLVAIQDVLKSQGFYDANHGGGLWVGKHYGRSDERHGDPVGDKSHAATVRQLLRFYLLLEQRRLVSPPASERMLEIFASPEIPHDPIKFVQALQGRDLTILRKWGTWENWKHDSAVIQGPGRHYILVALTHHANGDAYLVDLARAIDDFFQHRP